jgi:hypothetical protein
MLTPYSTKQQSMHKPIYPSFKARKILGFVGLGQVTVFMKMVYAQGN